MLLCDVCRARARAEALRPGEWFNLASVYSLDDPRLECYTIRGEATAPRSPVVDAAACPLPDEETVRRDLPLLLDWAIVYHGAGRSARAQQFHLEALRAFRLDEVLAAVQQARRPGPRDPYSVLVRVVAEAFGREAAPWVAAQLAGPDLSEAGLFVVPAIDAFAPERLASAVLPYFDRLEPADLLRRWDESLPQVAAAVPPAAAVRLVDRLLGRLPLNCRPTWACFALYAVRDQSVLDWMERAVFDPAEIGQSYFVDEPGELLAPRHRFGDWGQLAAAVGFDWPRAERWLARGRPLSIVALDAMITCARLNPDHVRAMVAERLRPLARPGARPAMTRGLRQAGEADGDPRVLARVELLLSAMGR